MAYFGNLCSKIDKTWFQDFSILSCIFQRLISLLFHIFPQELQEHRLFCSFYLMNQLSIIQQLGFESKSEFAVEQNKIIVLQFHLLFPWWFEYSLKLLLCIPIFCYNWHFLIQLSHMPHPNTRGAYFESLARGQN